MISSSLSFLAQHSSVTSAADGFEHQGPRDAAIVDAKGGYDLPIKFQDRAGGGRYIQAQVLGRMQRLADIAQGRGLAAADFSGDKGHRPGAHGVMNALLEGFQALGDKDVFQGDIGAEGFALQFEKKAVLRRHGFKAPFGYQILPPLGAGRSLGWSLGVAVAVALDAAVDGQIHQAQKTVALIV